MEQQTAVDWLFEEITGLKVKSNFELFKKDLEKAKAMEKEQMIDFAAQVSYGIGVSKDEMKKVAEQYYQQTYNK